MIITDEMRLRLTFDQRQEETVRILKEFVRRQEQAKVNSSKFVDILLPLDERTEFDYTDTAHGDL